MSQCHRWRAAWRWAGQVGKKPAQIVFAIAPSSTLWTEYRNIKLFLQRPNNFCYLNRFLYVYNFRIFTVVCTVNQFAVNLITNKISTYLLKENAEVSWFCKHCFKTTPKQSLQGLLTTVPNTNSITFKKVMLFVFGTVVMTLWNCFNDNTKIFETWYKKKQSI